MPHFTRCGCLSLRTGCLLLCIISTLACVGNITAGAWELPTHRSRDPEDNLISLSMIMFSSLSAISSIIALFGVCMNRPGNLRVSLLSNTVFILCIFVVAIVTCVFRLDKFFENPLHIILVLLLFLAGAAYSIYYLMVVNSYYRAMKNSYGGTVIPM